MSMLGMRSSTSGCFQAASILGPIVAGFMVGHELHLEYLVLLVAGCAAVAWLSIGRLEAQLDDRANGLLSPGPNAPEAAIAKDVGVAPPATEPVDSR